MAALVEPGANERRFAPDALTERVYMPARLNAKTPSAGRAEGVEIIQPSAERTAQAALGRPQPRLPPAS